MQSSLWAVRLITMSYCWPVYHSQPLEQLWLLQYSKLQMAKAFLWPPTMDRCKVHAWSTNECATMNGRLVTTIKLLSTIQSERDFSFLLSCAITSCWPVYHSQPLEHLCLLQYSKLQMAIDNGKILKVLVIVSYAWANITMYINMRSCPPDHHMRSDHHRQVYTDQIIDLLLPHWWHDWYT